MYATPLIEPEDSSKIVEDSGVAHMSDSAACNDLQSSTEPKAPCTSDNKKRTEHHLIKSAGDGQTTTSNRYDESVTILPGFPDEKPKKADNEAYQCRFCGLSYNYMTTLKAHERVHNVAEPYVCTKCGESFGYNCELQYHMASHKDQKLYKCSCGKSFYRYTDLLYHTHPGEESDGESVDDVEAPEGSASSGAFRPVHPLKVYNSKDASRVRPYVCQYCCRAFADTRQLTQHMVTHRGERSFNVRSSQPPMSRDMRLADMP